MGREKRSTFRVFTALSSNIISLLHFSLTDLVFTSMTPFPEINLALSTPGIFDKRISTFLRYFREPLPLT